MEKKPLPTYIGAIYKRPILARMLGAVAKVLVAVTVLSFAGSIVYLALESATRAILFSLLCAIPFVAVSVLRVWINAYRPYEVYDFGDIEAPRGKSGRSMPSRHVFSAFVIGTLGCFVHTPLGVFVLAIGVLIAFLRVLLGIHFVRDTLIGAAVGALSGVIGGVIINYCLR